MCSFRSWGVNPGRLALKPMFPTTASHCTGTYKLLNPESTVLHPLSPQHSADVAMGKATVSSPSSWTASVHFHSGPRAPFCFPTPKGIRNPGFPSTSLWEGYLQASQLNAGKQPPSSAAFSAPIALLTLTSNTELEAPPGCQDPGEAGEVSPAVAGDRRLGRVPPQLSSKKTRQSHGQITAPISAFCMLDIHCSLMFFLTLANHLGLQ